MPVQTRQTTRTAIAAETARDIAFTNAQDAVPGSFVEFAAQHRAAVRHELGADGQPVTDKLLRDTLMRRYIASRPDWPEPTAAADDGELTAFAIGDTVQITRGLSSIDQYAPDYIVGHILAINRDADLADVLISHPDGDDAIAHVIPLA
jgi:hypothetical protein